MHRMSNIKLIMATVNPCARVFMSSSYHSNKLCFPRQVWQAVKVAVQNIIRIGQAGCQYKSRHTDMEKH